MRACHPRVGDRGSAAGLYAGVRGLDVGVGADHGGHAPVEPARQRDLLARRLGVDVDEHDRVVSRASSTSSSTSSHMLVAGCSDSEPITLTTPDVRAVGGWDDREAAARRLGREVRRADDAIGGGEVGRDLLAAPGVVAERDRVGAGGEEALGELRRDADAVGDVLAVDDAERGVELGPQGRRAGPRAPRARGGRRRRR